MIFEKPLNLTFTQMAQWIDNNAYKSDCDETVLCQYLYHLIRIKTQQYSLIKDPDDVDDFVLYAVSKLLIRYRSKNDPKPIKSIVNYLKTVLNPYCAEYIREFQCYSPESPIEDFDVNDFADYLIDSASEHDYTAYTFDCFKVSDVVIKYLAQIPKRKFHPEWSNICISCLLTLHDRIKLAAKLTQKTLGKENPQLRNIIVRTLRCNPPILFHLHENFTNYISVLVNELTHAIAVELTEQTASPVTVSECLHSLVAAAANEEET